MSGLGFWPPVIDTAGRAGEVRVGRSARAARPIYVRTRRHPTANRIAAELAAWPALANLRWSRIVADVRQRFGIGETTAAIAVRLFLQQVRP